MTDPLLQLARPVVGLVRLPHSEGLDLPAYETAGAAGMDLRAAVPEDEPLTLAPGARALRSGRRTWGSWTGKSR